MSADDKGPLATRAGVRAYLEAEFRRLRAAGWSVLDIAAEFDVSRSTVCEYTRGHPRRRKLTDGDRLEVRRLRAAGWKLAQLARRFRVSTPTVVKVCKPDRPHPPPTKLTPERAAELRAAAATGRHTQRELARLFGLSPSGVCHVVTGRSWPAAGGPITRVGSGRAKKLTPDGVRQARRWLAEGVPQSEIGRRLEVSQTLVSRIALGKAWRGVE